jgi:cytidylate kinase
VAVVTISRQFGAAGRPVGIGLAQRLGAEYLDRRLVAAAAERAGLSVEEAEGYDEQVPGLLQRLTAALATDFIDPVMLPTPLEPEVGMTIHDRLSSLTRAAIEEAAERDDAVILGRGGAFILRGRPGVLHVQLHASLDDRVRLLAGRVATIPVEEIPPDVRPDEDSLRRLCEEMDARRAAYIRRHYDVDWLDASHYDLSLDSGHLSVDVMVDLIAMAARHVARRSGPVDRAAAPPS